MSIEKKGIVKVLVKLQLPDGIKYDRDRTSENLFHQIFQDRVYSEEAPYFAALDPCGVVLRVTNPNPNLLEWRISYIVSWTIVDQPEGFREFEEIENHIKKSIKDRAEEVQSNIKSHLINEQ